MRQRLHDPAQPTGALYDAIGGDYSAARRTEPRIAQAIWRALGDAESVLNVGAGAGSYEPHDRRVIAVEPSAVMRAQRPPAAAPCIAAPAERLPFPDRSFDAAMAVLSDHHWRDPVAGLREMARVARRVVVFQWDDALIPEFWLVRDYLPEFQASRGYRPTFAERARILDARSEPVPIPWDCVDGFFHAFWRRPYAYLLPEVRAGTSAWTRVSPDVEGRAVAALKDDLERGCWHRRNGHLLELAEADLGARILIRG